MTGHAEYCSVCRKPKVYTVSGLRNKNNGEADWIEICGDCLFKNRKKELQSIASEKHLKMKKRLKSRQDRVC